MTVQLLPPDFDEILHQAIATFWSGRGGPATGGQAGGRGRVIAGQKLDGFFVLVDAVARHVGVSPSAVYTRKSQVTLPGYFRATKNWDALVVQDGQLLAALELKSQVGSLGNNVNNRAEEALGSATDFAVAQSEGAFRRTEGSAGPLLLAEPVPAVNPALYNGGLPPFVGWVMLLEDSPDAHRPVSAASPHFPARPEFQQASYAERYRILCTRLMERRLYTAAALVLTPTGEARQRALSPETSLHSFFRQLAGHLAARA
jgi:hypothetical protein